MRLTGTGGDFVLRPVRVLLLVDPERRQQMGVWLGLTNHHRGHVGGGVAAMACGSEVFPAKGSAD